ncbi:MAG: HAMP domain-containing protein, partial [Clostridiales bacterium]|nr:HAMP domain-containing protein [Clostridiales bacterium]
MIRRIYKKPHSKQVSISGQFYKLLGAILAPLLIMLATLMYMLISFNQEYSAILQNVNTAAEFNNDFQDRVHEVMWSHIINAKPEGELPWEEIDTAVRVLTRLQLTTTQSDNKWRVQSMLNMCENLRKYMIETSNTSSYDERIRRLEGDIDSVTALISSYMYDYIYDEIKEMTRLHGESAGRVLAAAVFVVTVSVFLIIIVISYSLIFTRRITRPINELCQKVQKLGGGDFSIKPIDTFNKEIKTLDDGFNDMVGRINALLDKEIEDQNALHRAEF